MANWTNLISSINNAIRQNGNQEITGSILQNVLVNIVSSVGKNATFVDLATPTTAPGIPEGPVFYLATTKGTYSNFGNLEVNSGLTILRNTSDGSWEKIEVPILQSYHENGIEAVSIGTRDKIHLNCTSEDGKKVAEFYLSVSEATAILNLVNALGAASIKINGQNMSISAPNGVAIATDALTLMDVARIYGAYFDGFQTSGDINIKAKTRISASVDTGELKVLQGASNYGFILRTVTDPNNTAGLDLIELLSTDGYNSRKYTFPAKAGEVALKSDIPDGLSKDVKVALVKCMKYLAWVNNSGPTVLNELISALGLQTSDIPEGPVIPDEPEEPAALGYVASGLVLHFDAIKNTKNGHVSNLSKWEDLSGNNYHASAYSHTAGTSTKIVACGSDSVPFDGATYFFSDANEPFSMFKAAGAGTLEIVFKQSDSETSVIFGTETGDDWPNVVKGVWYRAGSSGYITRYANTGTGNGVQTSVFTTRKSISITYDDSGTMNTQINGIANTDAASGGNMPTQAPFSIGGRMHATDGYAFKGEICAIRYYNRILTASERLANYNLDKERYNLA